jgi:sugar-specific transcriptional regulator TrmB/CBS domain-containing protein
MGEEEILQFLKDLGLSKTESDIYLFLAKRGPLSASFVAKKLRMERVHAYRKFKRLQEKGFVTATLERPTRFRVVPLEELLDFFINAKKTEISNLEKRREKLIASWRATGASGTEDSFARFQVVAGKQKILLKILSMVEETSGKAFFLTNGSRLIQQDNFGIIDEMLLSTQKRRVEFKVLTDISEKNLKIAENIAKRLRAKGANFECRHVSLDPGFFPCFLIKDEEEALLFGSSELEASLIALEDEGLWINDKRFISVLQAFFSQMWKNSTDIAMRVEELKTGIPVRETAVISDPYDAWAKITKALERADEAVVVITSSQSIHSIAKNDPFSKYCKQSVKFRIMATIDLDNLEAAKTLSLRYSVRHIPLSYVSMMVIDKAALFIFKSPPLSAAIDEAPFYLRDTFYTNDLRTIERASEMLSDIWKRGIEISRLSTQAGMELPRVQVSSEETVSEVAHKLLQKNAVSALIIEKNEPIGIISDKELLKAALDEQRELKKIVIRNVGFTPLITLKNDENIADVFKVAHERRLPRVAVLKNGQLLGMLAVTSTLHQEG